MKQECPSKEGTIKLITIYELNNQIYFIFLNVDNFFKFFIFLSYSNCSYDSHNYSALEVDQKQESQKLKDILQKSLCSMTDDTLMFIKKKLLGMIFI